MNIVNKITGNTLTAAEYTEHKNEPQNFITSSGQSLANNSVQLKQAAARYAANAASYVDSGAADAYVLGIIGSNDAITVLQNGARCRFRATNTNTGASTVNVVTLGAKTIKKNGYADDLIAGDITSGNIYELTYNSGLDQFELTDLSNTIGINNGLVLLDTTSVSSSVSTVDLSWVAPTTKEILVIIRNLETSGDFELWLRTSTDSGSSYDSGGTDYEYTTEQEGVVLISLGDSELNVTRLTIDTSATNISGSAEITIKNPKNAAQTPSIDGQTHFPNSTGNSKPGQFNGSFKTANAQIDGIQFLLSGGTIEKGDFDVYGVTR